MCSVVTRIGEAGSCLARGATLTTYIPMLTWCSQLRSVRWQLCISGDGFSLFPQTELSFVTHRLDIPSTKPCRAKQATDFAGLFLVGISRVTQSSLPGVVLSQQDANNCLFVTK